MATLLHLAGPGAAGLVAAAPFILIGLLHRTCALWRDWATTRTYAAHEAALRTQLATRVDLAQEHSVGVPMPPYAPALGPTSHGRPDE